MTPCTCGEPHPHTIATRRTFDGALVELASDGALWVNGQRSPESGAAPVRADDAIARARRVGWLVMADACILDAADVTDLYRRGRALPSAPATMRELRAALAPKPPPRTLGVWRSGLDPKVHGLRAAESVTAPGNLLRSRTRMDPTFERVPNPARAKWEASRRAEAAKSLGIALRDLGWEALALDVRAEHRHRATVLLERADGRRLLLVADDGREPYIERTQRREVVRTWRGLREEDAHEHALLGRDRFPDLPAALASLAAYVADNADRRVGAGERRAIAADLALALA